MLTTGQQILLQGKPVVLFWAKTRPVVKEVTALRNGDVTAFRDGHVTVM